MSSTIRQSASGRTGASISVARFAALFILALTVACSDAPTRSAPLVPAATTSLAIVASEETPDQLAVAQAVPGFGGYFIDGTGAPTVYLTDVSRRAEAEAALAGFLASFGWTARDLNVRQADYSYLQLDAWYRQAMPRALAVAGAVAADLDESRNRLRFGGVDASALVRIADAVADAGVPAAATVVQLRAPIVQVATLRDQVRPLSGGLQINFFPVDASTVSLLCTLGFNALDDGVKSFVTNSHCSNVQGGTETPTQYYQNLRRQGSLTTGFSHYPGTDPGAYVGLEVEDPHYWVSLDCPPGRTCRYSDASRAAYADGLEFRLGKISRTTQMNPVTDTITIDAANPEFQVAGEQPLPVMGQVLHKVGRTTGWTAGQVVATCETINITASQITQLCQSLVAAYVAGGDSGSPVFGLNTDGSTFLAGLLWGSSTDLVTNEVQFIFSPLASVERELGDLTTVDPAAKGKKTKRPR